MGPDMYLELSWDIPVGKIPEHCLNWAVEHNKEGPDGKIMSVWITYCINFTLLTNSHWHQLETFITKNPIVLPLCTMTQPSIFWV